MAAVGKSRQPMSLSGPLRSILIPRALGFDDPRELGRAMVAWQYDLSREDVRLLEHVARGLTDSEIAARMRVAEQNTVKNRLRKLYIKLGVHNRTQAAIVAALYGLAEHPPSSRNSNE
jgi:DNA-binding NarL/FixJ family response regulator